MPETRQPKKPAQPPGKEALAFVVQLVEGKKVRLEFDRQRKDKYKRLLAYVYVGDIMLNAELVRQGYAQVTTLPPNVKYQELLLQLQREAREAKRGLWEER
jgi:micrococcal nuclease